MTDNSILAVDFGNIHTRALLIDLVEGVYRLVAQSPKNARPAAFRSRTWSAGFRRVAVQIDRQHRAALARQRRQR